MKDKQLWFKAKRYGWGWYPITWQGWLIIAIYLIVIFSFFTSIDKYSHSGSDTLINFSLPLIGLTSLLLSICYLKGEEPRWRWGSSWPESQKILREIRQSKSILLHCHPSPDPDSVGSTLAMKFAVEQLGKKATIIQGDSEIPQAFMHFPGTDKIVKKNFWEIDVNEFDLFLVLDSSLDGVSRMKDVKIKEFIPATMKIINIDHHRTNTGAGFINVINTTYPATCLILFELFKEWGIKIDSNIASNLFIGTYTDTGGFKYEGVTPETFRTAAELAEKIESIPQLISKMENTNTPNFIAFEAAALSSIEIFYGGILAISSVSQSALQSKSIASEDASAGHISSFLRTVAEWGIVACAIETEPNIIKVSFRSADSVKYDVGKLAAELGGGGHKAAAGVLIRLPLDQAIKKIVDTVKIIYKI